MKTERILVINNGSTSTKVAIYENEKQIAKADIEVTPEQVKDFKFAIDQKDFRTGIIMEFLKRENLNPAELSAVVARAGALPAMESGAYKINPLMTDILERFPTMQHANNLSAIIAYDIAASVGIPALIYDGDTMDEFEPEARVLGLKGFQRVPTCHALNMKSVARLVAEQLGRPYDSLNLIIVHLGGGISLSAHRRGRIIDDIFDDEGPMSPQRAGRFPTSMMVDICYSGRYTKAELQRLLRGNGGLMSLIGTQDAREIEKRIEAGDKEAENAYFAMAYQVAKGVGELATVLRGEVDRIVFTGGMAHGKMFVEWVKERVGFIAPIEVIPGEREMEGLALGALRVLKGEENAMEYDSLPANYVPRA